MGISLGSVLVILPHQENNVFQIWTTLDRDQVETKVLKSNGKNSVKRNNESGISSHWVVKLKSDFMIN